MRRKKGELVDQVLRAVRVTLGSDASEADVVAALTFFQQTGQLTRGTAASSS